jgi:hypothetical protein
MTDLAIDIKKLVDQLDNFPASSRDAIISELNARASERKANAMRVPLKSPIQAMAADERNKPLLRQVIAQLARVGYDIADGTEKISMTKLNDCIRANAERMHVDGWDLKTNLAILNLVP